MVALVVRLRQRAREVGHRTAVLGPAALGWARQDVARPGKDGGPDGRISGSSPLADTRGEALAPRGVARRGREVAEVDRDRELR
jgi:hypothetical protein